MNTKSRALSAVASVLFALAVAGCNQSGSSTLSRASGGESVEIKPTDMVHGSKDAPVTMVEYASMTCPHCAAFQKEVIPLLNKDYVDTGKVKVVFREYPLDGAARMASAVARCLSGDQYFSFIDLLFKNQMNWIKDFDGNGTLNKEDVLEGLTQMGRVAGLSADQVKTCSEDPKNLALVDGNWMEGQTKYNVNSTPTFIINGTSHAGEIPYADLQKILDPLVKK
jgi:protein-disulfide isomerase